MANATIMESRFISPRSGSELTREGEFLRSPAGEAIPIVSGIPRFTPSDYAGGFGLQWNHFAKTQLDSFTGTTISRDRLCRVLGGTFDRVAGRRVLEVGAGAGRFTEILAQYAREVQALDLSTAIDANRANNQRFANVGFAQASVFELPFPEGWFDLAVCLGVIQHTPDPAAALRCLAGKVKKGGFVAVDFYRLRLSFLTRFGLLIARRLVSARDPESAFRAVTRLYDLFEPLHRRFARSLLSYLLIGRISPIVTYYHRKDWNLSEELLREWGYLDTHDFLTDRYKFLFTVSKVKKMCAACGLRPIRLALGGNGIELLAERF